MIDNNKNNPPAHFAQEQISEIFCGDEADEVPLAIYDKYHRAQYRPAEWVPHMDEQLLDAYLRLPTRPADTDLYVWARVGNSIEPPVFGKICLERFKHQNFEQVLSLLACASQKSI